MQAAQREAARAAAPAIDRDLWERRLVPLVGALIRSGYFSFDVEGAEHLPRDGCAVYATNHAGWFPLDALFLGLAVRSVLGPGATPFFATADAALAVPMLGPLLRRAGALPASSFRRPERLPKEISACGMFPEGVEGNTKPFWQAYRMRPWKRGFVRVAAALDVPIVPATVLGGEECLPVAWTVKLLEPLVGSRFGLPLAPVPLPARWRVVFHRPVRLRGNLHRALVDAEYTGAIAARVRSIVQREIDRQAARYPLAHVSSWLSPRDRALAS